MTPEQMQKIVDGAPEHATHYEVLFGNINYMQQHNGKWYWFGNVAKEWYLDCMNDSERLSLDDLRTELAKRDTLDLEPADIPHGTIVLEK